MLEKVRKSLRITHSHLDDEIQDLIAGALSDLQLSGVVKLEETDALILRAVVLYCKANFGLDNIDSDKYQASYNSLKAHLCLAGDYNSYV